MSSSEKRVAFKAFLDLFERAKKKLEAYKHIVLVMSGKGGVGKSFITSALAVGLAIRGRSVAILDADIHGSSIPILLGLQGEKHYATEEGEILPVEGPLGVKVVAINLMLDSPDTPVVWRGPLLAKAIVELVARTAWGSGDYLLVDMPPGTGDVAITVVRAFPRLTGTILVTAPNALSETIVSKAANFAKSSGVKLLGVVENMSFLKCPHCGNVINVMGNLSSERLASKYGTTVLGKIPLDPAVNEYVEKGIVYLLTSETGELAKCIMEVVDRVINLVEHRNNQD